MVVDIPSTTVLLRIGAQQPQIALQRGATANTVTAQDRVREGVGVADTEAAYPVSVISKLLGRGGDQITVPAPGRGHECLTDSGHGPVEETPVQRLPGRP